MVQRQSLHFPAAGGRPMRAFLATPEDVILQKLDWYRRGEGVSDRQWRDVLGVLKVQGERLDFTYIQDWAERLGFSDLLSRALKEGGNH